MRIKQIEIQNYKAFKDRDQIEVDGKNLLVYGNNGSGKSSLYFALHALLQSSSKTNAQIQKYFDPTHSENLLNLFVEQPNTSPTTNSYVKIVTDDSAEYQFSPAGNTTGHPIVQLANQASDFINYRLLLGFYNFRNSEEADLFPIFRKEFFPYWTDPQRNINYEEWYQSLEAHLKALEQENIQYKNVRANSKKYTDFKRLLNEFNSGFAQRLFDLNEPVNKYLREDFLPDEQIEVRLQLKEVLRRKRETKWVLDAPVVPLFATYEGKDVRHPHTFLNEARLTALALSIWFAASDARLKQSDLKLLVLDDVLISLDMSMRMQVLKIILNKYAGEYQIFILTHDKSFFNIVKQNLILKDDDWKTMEFYENRVNGRYANPCIVPSEDTLKKAEDFLHNRDYGSCALYLRKKAEELIRIYYDPTLVELARFQVLETLANSLREVQKQHESKVVAPFLKVLNHKWMTLSRIQALQAEKFQDTAGLLADPKDRGEAEGFRKELMKFLEEYCRNRAANKREFDQLLEITKKVNEIKSRALNAGAHPTNEPLYDVELKGAIRLLQDFEDKVKKDKENPTYTTLRRFGMQVEQLNRQLSEFKAGNVGQGASSSQP